MPLTPDLIVGSPSLTGEVDWTDTTDNWRAVDAEWLQAHSVICIDGDTPGASGDLIPAAEYKGRLYYTTSRDKIIVNVGDDDDPAYETVLASNAVVVNDSVPTVAFGIAEYLAGGEGVFFDKSNGEVSVGSFSVNGTFKTEDLVVDNSLTVKVGSNSSAGLSTSLGPSGGIFIDTSNVGGDTNRVKITTADTKLNISKGVAIATGGLTVTAGGVTVTAGGITVDGASTISGGLAVNGGVTLNNTGLTVTTGGLRVNAGTTALQATTATSLTSPSLTTSSGDLTVSANQNIKFTAATVNGFGAYFVPNSGAVDPSTSARMAFVVTGSGLSASSYPVGTIWIA